MNGKRLIPIVALLMASTLAATLAVADDPLPVAKLTPAPTVYLRGLLDLEKLKESNPGHYLRAQRIMADAEEICQPGPDQVHYARYASQDVRCQSMFFKTSYPAKREIGFTLDGVRYVALVEVKNGEPQFRQVPGAQLPGALDPAH